MAKAKTKKKATKTKVQARKVQARKAPGRPAVRVAQTPLANALAALIAQIAAQQPRGSAIATQAERATLRRQGNVGRSLVQTVSAHVASGKLDVKSKLDPAAAATTVARITAFWPLIDEMKAVATLMEDALIREAAALSVLVSSTATVIAGSVKGDPTNAHLANAHKSIVAARKKRDPLLPVQARKPGKRTAAPATPPARARRTQTTTTTTTDGPVDVTVPPMTALTP